MRFVISFKVYIVANIVSFCQKTPIIYKKDSTFAPNFNLNNII